MSYPIEQKWINYWSDLNELVDKLGHPILVDENFVRINQDEAQARIQDGVYDGNDVEFLDVMFEGKKAVQVKIVKHESTI